MRRDLLTASKRSPSDAVLSKPVGFPCGKGSKSPLVKSVYQVLGGEELRPYQCTVFVAKTFAITILLSVLLYNAEQLQRQKFRAEPFQSFGGAATSGDTRVEQAESKNSLPRVGQDGEYNVDHSEGVNSDQLPNANEEDSSDAENSENSSNQEPAASTGVNAIIATGDRERQGRYLGICYDACEQVRNLLLGPNFEPGKVIRLRSATCVHFVPGRGFCDSLISKGRMEKEVFTKGYMRQGRKFFGNVSMMLPPTVGGSIVFMPSDATDDVLDHEIDALWDNKTPFLPHSIMRRETLSYITMPDYHFIMGEGFQGFREFIAQRDKPYNEREPLVFWRGSSTSEGLDCTIVEDRASGSSFLESGCATTARVKIALRALEIPHLDARISAVTDCCVDKKEEMSKAGILADRMPEFKWTRFRGVLEVDGLVNAWGNFWRLYSGSVVFRVESEYMSFYGDRLKPWIHYVPVKADLSDLRERTSMVLSNETADIMRLSRIAENARDVIRNITYASEIRRVSTNLVKLWQPAT